jgi:hypothetical protein
VHPLVHGTVRPSLQLRLHAVRNPKYIQPSDLCNAMQCNAMQCNAMQCNAMQCMLSVVCRVYVVCCLPTVARTATVRAPHIRRAA